ncbi:MAG: molybdopterin-dependent oxidoreductase [Candidatus Glassbacteria bacterium]
MRTVRTVCSRDCYDSCFMIVTVDDDGKVRSVKGDPSNPITRGFTCPRGNKDAVRVYQDRVLYPHVRTGGKPGRGFRKATWTEALDMIARRLVETIDEHGSDSVLLLDYAGNQGVFSLLFPHRLWNAIGAVSTDYAICSTSGHAGLSFHYGESYGIQPEEINIADPIIFWGFNAPVSSPHLWSLATEARKKNGAVIITIDPRQSQSAKGADLWIRPAPGSDVALAMGVYRYLIMNGHVDLDFINEKTIGFEKLREEALSWSPERICEETGLEWTKVCELGKAYAESNQSATLIGIGLQKNYNGADLVRAVSLIPALRGQYRGFLYTNGRAYIIDSEYLTGQSLTGGVSKITSQVSLSTTLSKGEFRFLFIYSMNPALTLPNQTDFRHRLSAGDIFTAVHETHWTETTDYADVVLPAPTFLEKDDLVIPWSHRHIRLSRKAIEPLGDSRDEVWVMRELARRLNLHDEWLYEEPLKALEKALDGAIEDGSLKDLKAGKDLHLVPKPPERYRTPSGKLEFYSEMAQRQGFGPLPRHRPLKAGPDEFFLLNTASRNYTNTQFRGEYGPIPPFLMMSPPDASRLGIEESDEVTVQNDLGSIRLRVKVTPEVPKGVLWSPRQLISLGGEPMNSITSDEHQKLGKGPMFNSTTVRVRR